MGILNLLRGVRQLARAVAGVFRMSPSTVNVKKLNAASMLVEAGLALRKGRKKRAALLFGAATLASRWSLVGYLVEGGLTLDRVRRRLF